MLNFPQIGALLSTPQKIVITTHHKPDADALGSSLALWNYLTAKGHTVQVITPTDYPKFLNWMEGNDGVLNYEDGNQQKAAALISDADIIFCLDFCSLGRINDLGPLVEKSSATKMLIDHHLNKQSFADIEMWDNKASATCELIYEFIDGLGDAHMVTQAIGECIYAGIMTDTGSFRHPSTTRKTHLIVAELIGIGIRASRIHRLVYDNNKEIRLRFLGYTLSEKLKVIPEYHAAYMAITSEELKKYESQTGDTEGLVNFALSVEGVKVAAVFIDRTEAVKISFRSVEDYAVNEFAAEYFDGGGHKNAAGGKSDLSLEETVDKFIRLLPEVKPSLKETQPTI